MTAWKRCAVGVEGEQSELDWAEGRHECEAVTRKRDSKRFYDFIIVFLFWSWLSPPLCHSPPSVFNSPSSSCHYSARPAPLSSQSNTAALSLSVLLTQLSLHF